MNHHINHQIHNHAHPKKFALQLLAVITTPKLAEKTSEMFKKAELPLQYRFSAEGTASSEMMDMLGLGSIEKCMLISVVPKMLSLVMLKRLHSELKLDTVNSGIAFTIPINGANNLILRMLGQLHGEHLGKDDVSMADSNHVLVAAIVNRGFSADVMTAAKSAGARGGTVIFSRRIGSEEVAGFWGLSEQEEKEIVLILSEAADKLPIMQSISDSCGMHSEAKGLVTSMPIDSVIGI